MRMLEPVDNLAKMRIDSCLSGIDVKLESLVANDSKFRHELALVVVVLVHVSDGEIPRKLLVPEILIVTELPDDPLNSAHDFLPNAPEISPVGLLKQFWEARTKTLMEWHYQVTSEDISAESTLSGHIVAVVLVSPGLVQLLKDEASSVTLSFWVSMK